MSTLCAHCQGMPERSADKSTATEVVAASRMPWVKGVDVQNWHCTAREMFPNQQVLARVYMLESDEASYIRAGSSGARLYVTRLRPIYDKILAGGVAAVEGPNEHYPDGATLSQHVDFWCEWLRLMCDTVGTMGGFVTSTGRPGLAYYGDDEDQPGRARSVCAAELAPIYRALLDYGGLWCAHEYGAPTLRGSAPHLMLRYRLTLHELAPIVLGWRDIQVIVSECGVDGGVLRDPKQVHWGWRRYMDVAAYQQELAWYDDELAKDPQVLAATVYTTCPTKDWSSFDVNGELLAWMAARHNDDVIPEPEPEPPTPAPDTGAALAAVERAWQAVLTAGCALDSAEDALLEAKRALGDVG